jgi:hypothetical protein
VLIKLVFKKHACPEETAYFYANHNPKITVHHNKSLLLPEINLNNPQLTHNSQQKFTTTRDKLKQPSINTQFLIIQQHKGL